MTTRCTGSGRSTSSSARVSMSCLIDLTAAAQPKPSAAMLQPWSPLNVCGSQRVNPHSRPCSPASGPRCATPSVSASRRANHESASGAWPAPVDRRWPGNLSPAGSSQRRPPLERVELVLGIVGLDGRGEGSQADADGCEVGVVRPALPQPPVAGLGLNGGDARARCRVAAAGALLATQGDDAGAELGSSAANSSALCWRLRSASSCG